MDKMIANCWTAAFTALLLISQHVVGESTADRSGEDGGAGYMMYCPCMGRFGNQAEHFLGSLAFAKMIGRALILPPWPTMRGYVPFDRWFQLSAIKEYHDVLSAEEFFSSKAAIVWPVERRVGLCYMPRSAPLEKCDLKSGAPFGPFWNHLEVEFADSEFYSLTYHKEHADEWKQKFSTEDYPVLAFKGAPAPYPVKEENAALHKYMQWTEEMVTDATEFLHSLIGDSKYIAVHLRNGVDWERACQAGVGMTSFMASPQCLGYTNSGTVTQSMCLPSIDETISKVRQAVVSAGVRLVYVLTDKRPMKMELESALADLDVRVVHGDPDIPQTDLIIAARAEIFLGNCVSSFSAFIKREREFVFQKPSMFFGID